MKRPETGDKIADVKLSATGGQTLQLSDFRGKKIVLYFYPRDNTPGCTLESQNFRDNQKQFSANNAVILGVSRDNVKSHERFKDKQALNFELLADTDERLCKQFDVIREKNMYGKKVFGIERSTFLIDEHGALLREWRKVKIEGHVEEVLAEVKKRA